MKRKRGNKKGKKKAPPLAPKNEASPTLVTLVRDDNSDDDDDDDNGHNDNNKNDSNNNEEEYERRMEVDTPSSTGTDQPLNLASINPDGSIDKTKSGKSVGRVKVKLKTSKMLESQSDTDKSSLQLGLEKQGAGSDKMEDTGNSVSEVKTGVSGNVSKKPGIKIKSSKVMGGLSSEKNSGGVMAKHETLQQKEPRTPHQESQYNKQELDSALSVIKKVMKMDAAEPFNVPVNPEALGIPDYFDIIDTPMDFGTICSNLEMGEKYMNSEDVYKDVQYIWDNCYKYNNKGDYILDLMKRVKKNFMKYWIAAGLFTEQSKGSSGADGTQGDDAGASSQGPGKSGQPKQKGKKRHGRRHKSDCLCAICVLKRRRREREEKERLANQSLAKELKQEGSSLMESPAGEDSSSNMDESLDADADAEVEGKELEVKMDDAEQQQSAEKEKHEEMEELDEDDNDEEEDEEEENEIEIQKQGKVETSGQSEFSDKSKNEPNQLSQPGLAENEDAVVQTHSLKNETAVAQQNKNKESQERQQRAKMFEKFLPDNPMILSLCQTLFPDNCTSVWSGPHSLFPRQDSSHKHSISPAVETLMK